MKQTLKKIKLLLTRAYDAIRLPFAYLYYQSSGVVPPWAGWALINAYCLTGGRSNGWINNLISRRFPPRHLDLDPQMLKPLTDQALGDVTRTLKEKGWVILGQKVPMEVCDRLFHFASVHPAVLRQTDKGEVTSRTALYDAVSPQAVLYDFEKEPILANADVQALLVDPVLLSIAQAYFGCEPIADMLSMWWSTAYSEKADGEAAQLYHFDMERIKWLKFFVYLTDVDHDNGPHYFVAGSHRNGGIPQSLLKKGYVRLQDEEVAACYRPQDIIEVTAPRGSILVEDTRGLHKGQHVRRGHRLLLQFQYSSSRFGPEIERAKIHAGPDSRLAQTARRYPRMFSGYEISE